MAKDNQELLSQVGTTHSCGRRCTLRHPYRQQTLERMSKYARTIITSSSKRLRDRDWKIRRCCPQVRAGCYFLQRWRCGIRRTVLSLLYCIVASAHSSEVSACL